MRGLKPLILTVLLGSTSAAAWATPATARLYQHEYGYTPSCNACHSSGGGTELNQYGKDLKAAGHNRQAFAKVAAKDSDGDGVPNAVEAKAKANPGDKQSTPKSPGNWLDPNSLIPKEVRAEFAAVRQWMTRDGVLTDADIKAAAVLGAALSKADENTIYIPLENQRPMGTALIFPAKHGGKTFYLLMTTDRQLVVTKVQVLNAEQVPAAKGLAVYKRFERVAVDKLPIAKSNTLDDAVIRAVKQAGSLLHVRLKGA
ncbi:MAG: hypothetical protein Q8K94_06020 [Moraxellaceae bacterium]|nr:hypothetical protein [Moraxellaceae bacterium]MDP1776158.1 hypothetical protein [Moraxellaceae bacterium]